MDFTQVARRVIEQVGYDQPRFNSKNRIGAYAARHAAKNVVAAGLADECEVQLNYTSCQPVLKLVSIKI